VAHHQLGDALAADPNGPPATGYSDRSTYEFNQLASIGRIQGRARVPAHILLRQPQNRPGANVQIAKHHFYYAKKGGLNTGISKQVERFKIALPHAPCPLPFSPDP